MDLQLKEKIIIVTGGARGIGAGICKALAKEGAIPVIGGRNEEDNLAIVKEIEETGGRAGHVVVELVEPDNCKKLVDNVIIQFGRIDGLVNNAGINDGVGLESGSYQEFVQSL